MGVLLKNIYELLTIKIVFLLKIWSLGGELNNCTETYLWKGMLCNVSQDLQPCVHALANHVVIEHNNWTEVRLSSAEASFILLCMLGNGGEVKVCFFAFSPSTEEASV